MNIAELRSQLKNFINDNTPVVPGTEEVDTQPTLGFQRVIQRAIMHVQSTSNGKKEVTGANVLVAIFGEKDSHAVYYLPHAKQPHPHFGIPIHPASYQIFLKNTKNRLI